MFTLLAFMALAPDAINGSALYRERMAVPPGAVFEAQLVSSAGKTLSRVVLTNLKAPPYRFNLGYDSAQVEPSTDYEVLTRIVLNGQTLFSSAPKAVLTKGQARQAGELLLRRPASLTGTRWRLLRLGDKAVPAKLDANLTLVKEGNRAQGSGGCNTFGGAYSLEGAKLSFGRVASTMRACLEGMESETAFYQSLEATRGYRISGQTLDLLDGEGRLLARLEADKPAI